VKNYSKKIHL